MKISANEKIVKNKDVHLVGYVTNLLYPKEKEHESGTFAIFRAVVRLETSEIGFSTVFKGRAPEVIIGQSYNIIADEIFDPKYGPTYEIKRMNSIVKWEDMSQVKKFLGYLFSSNVVKELFKRYPNPIEAFEAEDIDGLMKIPGIGRIKAEKLISRYKDSKDNAAAYAALYDVGLTQNTINRLIDVYHSADTAVDKVMNHPYDIIREVKGIGWTTADKWAQESGIAENSPDRIKGYFYYHLNEKIRALSATYTHLRAIFEEAKKLSPLITEDLLKKCFDEEVAAKRLHYDEETQRVGLESAYQLEKRIAKEIVRLKKATVKQVGGIDDVISKCERRVGYEYSDEQKDAIHKILNNNVSLLTAKAGCVDCDTEYFNGYEWKRIADYTEGEKVLQYNLDGTAELVIPSRYIKQPQDRLWYVHGSRGMDMCVSDDHNVCYLDAKKQLVYKPFSEIRKIHDQNSYGFTGKFLTTFNYSGPGIDLNDNEIKIMLAVICDGSLYGIGNHLCRFHIKKDRKKEELRKLFAEGNVKYRERPNAIEGYTDFYIEPPIRSKVFTKEWYNCSSHQLQLICDNIMKWDGSTFNTGKKYFSTTIKENADFVQFAYTVCGYRTTISQNDRSGKEYFTCNKIYTRHSTEYKVIVTSSPLISMSGGSGTHKTTVDLYKTRDGFEYCFTVPSHMWVMRRNNRILITKNCGKSASMFPVVEAMKENGLIVSQCCLSGRAALNLTEATGLEGKTIHRLLGWRPRGEDKSTGGFTYDSSNPLKTDMVILDEVSMVGGEIFLSLLKAIPSGARLVMVGDFGQLEPIGIGNIGYDISQSGIVPHCHLTQIFRQAKMSGIIAESSRVYEGEQIIPNNYSGTEIRGVLQDLKIVGCKDTQECYSNIISEFRRLYEIEHIPIKDIIICAAKRSSGALSTRVINDAIQQYVKVAPGAQKITMEYLDAQVKYKLTLREGDKVSVIENQYDTCDIEGESSPIFNGNVGVIDLIDPVRQEIIVEFPHAEVVIPRRFWGCLRLGYAITTHRAQGIGVPYVIAVADPSAYTLLSKELLYTQLTRAKKYCTLIGTAYSIRFAAETTRVQQKQTWLKELLLEANKTYDPDAETNIDLFAALS